MEEEQEKKAYKPRVKSEIDYIALIIYVMKNGKTITEIAGTELVGGVHRVTINNNITRLYDLIGTGRLSKQEEKLLRMYKERYAVGNKTGDGRDLLSREDKFNLECIDTNRPIIIEEKKDEMLQVYLARKACLINHKGRYTEAANELGISRPALVKSLDKLIRIEAEREIDDSGSVILSDVYGDSKKIIVELIKVLEEYNRNVQLTALLFNTTNIYELLNILEEIKNGLEEGIVYVRETNNKLVAPKFIANITKISRQTGATRKDNTTRIIALLTTSKKDEKKLKETKIPDSPPLGGDDR